MRNQRQLRDLLLVLGLLTLIAWATKSAPHSPQATGTPSVAAATTPKPARTTPAGTWQIEGLSLGMLDGDKLEARGKSTSLSFEYGDGPGCDPDYKENPKAFPYMNRYHIRQSRLWSAREADGGFSMIAGALSGADQKLVGVFGKQLRWGTDEAVESGDSDKQVLNLLGQPLSVQTCGARHQGRCEHWQYRDGLTVYLRKGTSGETSRVGILLLGTTAPFREVLGTEGFPACLLTADTLLKSSPSPQSGRHP